MATIENFLLRFKVEGQQAIKQAGDSIKNLRADLDNFAQVGGPLQNTLNGLIGRLPLLANAAVAVGVAFAALGARGIKLGDELGDLADATDISAGALLNFRNSVIEAGGKADDFQQIAAKLNQSVQEAAGGNEKFTEAFKRLGVFVLDAEGKVRSTESILRDLTDRFKEGRLTGEQYAAAIDLLGKNINKLDLTKLDAAGNAITDEQVQNITKLTGEIDKLRARFDELSLAIAGRLAGAINSAMDVYDRRQKEIMDRERELNLQGRTSRFATPPGQPPLSMPPNLLINRRMSAEEREAFRIQELERVNSAYRPRPSDRAPGADAGAGGYAESNEKIKQQIKLLDDLKARLAQQNSELQFGFGVNVRRLELERDIVGLSANEAEMMRLTRGLLEEKLKRYNDITNEVNKLNEEIARLNPEDKKQKQALEERIALLNAQKGSLDGIYKTEIDRAAAALKQAQAAREERADSLRYQKQSDELRKQVGAYDALRFSQQRISDQLRSDYQFQIRKLTMTEDEIELAEALNQETQRYLQFRDELGNKVRENFAAITSERNRQYLLSGEELKASQDRVELLESENQEIRKTIDSSYEGHMRNGRIIEENLGRLQRLRFEEKQRQALIEYSTKLIEQQLRTQENLADTIRKINDQKIEFRFEKSLKGLSPLRQQIAKFNEEARRAGLEAGRSLAGTFDEEDGLTPERAQQLADGLAAISQGYRDIADEQLKALGVSQEYLRGFPEVLDENLKGILEFQEEFKFGFNQAFEEYAESALDAAAQARDGFRNFTDGIEDAFVRFVQTGKLSFKDLANSILADLTRIAVKRAIVFAATSLFGIPIPGRAAGGPVDANKPYVVGEEGPELFVPKAAGTIVPNQAGGGTSANVGQTTVNYNINAVDAASFRALVARDPSFIYSVTEQGRRSQPTRRMA